MNDDTSKLIAEQMQHALDLVQAEVNTLRTQQEHAQEMACHRLHALEKISEDHEQRLRRATAGVTEFRLWSGLSSGASSVMAVIAFVRSFLGG